MDDSKGENDVERRIPPPISDLQVNFFTWPAGQHIWSSKQHGDSALMLFGDRVKGEQLNVIVESEVIIDSDTVLEVIDEEADQLGIVLIDDGEEPDISGPIQ
ncbi:hypothetical protein [Serratia quinivorans]|uniref:hypothetical protein n=1 Tax=Serratia quinivorans TaxID=137545 RepID=UPI00217B1C97|nr:hypothetical protein [Serratia quinivorans]CAI1136271.1 Uncharacterised protein [Serratia quinivorans]CAI1810871.1 Uncharacterised protein [Serratia quinivorans]